MYKIYSLERKNNSVNGNPKYEIYFKNLNGEFDHATTASDYAFCYGITNDIYSLKNPKVMAKLEFSKAGKITDFKVIRKVK